MAPNATSVTVGTNPPSPPPGTMGVDSGFGVGYSKRWPMEVTVVALTQISAHTVLRIKTKLYAKSGKRYVQRTQKSGLGLLDTFQTKHDANDHGTFASMWKESAHHLGRTSFLYFFSLVRTVYTHISSNARATAEVTWRNACFRADQSTPIFVSIFCSMSLLSQDAHVKGTFLIVSPGSVLYNWKEELETWGYFRQDLFHGTSKAGALERAKKGNLDVVLTTYETLRNHVVGGRAGYTSVSWLVKYFPGNCRKLILGVTLQLCFSFRR